MTHRTTSSMPGPREAHRATRRVLGLLSGAMTVWSAAGGF